MSNEEARARLNGQAEADANLTQEQKAMKKLFIILGNKADAIAQQLPAHISPEAFIGVCKTAVLNRPELAMADHQTFLIAALRAASDGLMPDGREAVFNIYNTKTKNQRTNKEEWIDAVQYLPMVGGLIKQLYQSGEVIKMDAACVYEKDGFHWVRGDDPNLTHEPTMADDPGRIIAAYVCITLVGGEIKREVMPRRDIERVKAQSKAGGPKSPWVVWYDQMAIKSVIKRVYKQIPHTEKLETLVGRIIEHDNKETGSAEFSKTSLPESIDHGNDFSAFSGGIREDGERVPAGQSEGASESADQSAPMEPAATVKMPEAGASDPHGLTQAGLIATMRKRSEVETLDIDADLISSLPADQQEEARQAYHAARAALTGDMPKGTRRQNRISGAE